MRVSVSKAEFGFSACTLTTLRQKGMVAMEGFATLLLCLFIWFIFNNLWIVELFGDITGLTYLLTRLGLLHGVENDGYVVMALFALVPCAWGLIYAVYLLVRNEIAFFKNRMKERRNKAKKSLAK